MNRLKFIVVLVVLALTTVLWFQNQDLLALQLFCPEPTEGATCLYLTPQLTVATWMIIFVVAGALSNLLSQVLARAGATQGRTLDRQNSEASRQFRREKSTSASRQTTSVSQANTLPNPEPKAKVNLSDWEQESSQDWDATSQSAPSSSGQSDIKGDRSNYKRRVQAKADSASAAQKKTVFSDRGSSAGNLQNQDRVTKKSGSDRKQVSEDVYDATYRTVETAQTPENPNKQVSEDDEQWI